MALGIISVSPTVRLWRGRPSCRKLAERNAEAKRLGELLERLDPYDP
jgi:hypothetical protein